MRGISTLPATPKFVPVYLRRERGGHVEVALGLYIWSNGGLPNFLRSFGHGLQCSRRVAAVRTGRSVIAGDSARAEFTGWIRACVFGETYTFACKGECAQARVCMGATQFTGSAEARTSFLTAGYKTPKLHWGNTLGALRVVEFRPGIRAQVAWWQRMGFTPGGYACVCLG